MCPKRHVLRENVSQSYSYDGALCAVLNGLSNQDFGFETSTFDCFGSFICSIIVLLCFYKLTARSDLSFHKRHNEITNHSLYKRMLKEIVKVIEIKPFYHYYTFLFHSFKFENLG